MIKKIILKAMRTEFAEKLLRKYWLYSLNKKKHLFMNTQEKPRLFWGPEPLINNKYWSGAMKDAGFKSTTVMKEYFSSINSKSDFDVYFEDILKTFTSVLLPPVLARLQYRLFIFEYLMLNYDIFHIPFSGILYTGKDQEEFEVKVMKMLGKKTLVIPYGADGYMYSRIKHTALQHVLLLSYPEAVNKEEQIEKTIRFWQKNADFTTVGFLVDGMARWDTMTYNILILDNVLWKAKQIYNENNGENGTVNIVHTPNHRGFKGTEFLIEAVNQLKEEGLKINLILLEKKQNSEVRQIFYDEADILVEQLICGYALSAIEGMATGIPVLSNLSIEEYTRIFRRYSYLNECPILSTTPENIKENLRILVKNPALRKELGLAGRKYVEKYHSDAAAQFLFNRIYDKIWYNKNVDLLNLFHPLNPNSFNNQSAKIEHPLTENKISDQLLKTLRH